MFVRTQWTTIVNLAEYSKIKIDYSIQSEVSDNVFDRIWVENIHVVNEEGKEKSIEQMLLEIPSDREHLSNTAFEDLFKALSDGERTFDMSVYLNRELHE